MLNKKKYFISLSMFCACTSSVLAHVCVYVWNMKRVFVEWEIVMSKCLY